MDLPMHSRKRIQLHDEAKGRNIQRITQTVINARVPRRHAAEDVLNKANDDLELLQEFLGKDHSIIIQTLVVDSDRHARIAFWSIDSGDRMLNLFFRLLCTRDLTTEYIYTSSNYRQGAARGRRHGSTMTFIRDRGLPERPTKNALKVGQKLLDIERQTDIPGISLVLMPAWYMFERFSEVEILATLLLHGDYAELKDVAHIMSKVLSFYQRWYSRRLHSVI
jgi:hypothetical protein